MNIHHAFWSKRFKTFYCKGSFAHELQIGPLVFYKFYDKNPLMVLGHFKIARDPFWNR